LAPDQFAAGATKADKVLNLELKVRCPGEEALDALIAQARAAGAVYIRTMGQRDVYLRAQCGRLRN
jgi:adenylate cyclase class IV